MGEPRPRLDWSVAPLAGCTPAGGAGVAGEIETTAEGRAKFVFGVAACPVVVGSLSPEELLLASAAPCARAVTSGAGWLAVLKRQGRSSQTR